MRRTLTVAVATAALMLLGGPLPVAGADGSGTARAADGWSAREAEAFWTPERMASAEPVTPGVPGTRAAKAGIGENFDGIPVVGRMFVMQGGGAYFCTASVVASPATTWC